MRKLNIFTLTSLLFAIAITPIIPNGAYTQADTGNLIANFDVELGEETPNDWHIGGWGDNDAQYSYKFREDIDSNAIGVEVEEYENGDAKWFFSAVDIKPNTTYEYRDNYLSTVSSNLVVRYTLIDNSFSYIYIGDVDASDDEWLDLSALITTPENAYQLTVFHAINEVGELWSDNFSLREVDSTPSDSLIHNPSVEEVSLGKPVGWLPNSWGSNDATFAHSSQAHDGSKSTYLNIADYQSGDAKWYFEHIEVNPGESYSYSDYSKGSVDSTVTAQYVNSSTGQTYHEPLGFVSLSQDWLRSEFVFTIPNDVDQLTVFHAIEQNGELWTDSFNISQIETPQPAIKNGSLESGSSTTPNNWRGSNWGVNDTTFEYLNTGHTGTRSVKTTVTQFSSGDAKWVHEPVELTPGEDYRFINYYKSNVSTKINLAITYIDGSIRYHSLEPASPSEEWKKYSSTFTMPYNAVNVMVFHLIAQEGFLITDDYLFTEYTPVGFDRSLITLTFDDNWEQNYVTAIPQMAKYGFGSNQFYAIDEITNSTTQNKEEVLRDIQKQGHEIGSHTVTHPDLTTLSRAQVQSELTESKSFLEDLFDTTILYFASPFGAYNHRVMAQINNEYALHRTVNVGYNAKDTFDIQQIRVQNVISTTTNEDVQAWTNKAMTDKTWLVLVYHRVGDNPLPFDTTPEMFEQQLNTISNSGVPVMTISEALDEILPQL